MITSTVGSTAPLILQLYDGNTSKYPRAFIRDSAGELLSLIDLNHVGNGLYLGSFDPSSSGYYHAVFTVYADINHTQEDYTYTVDMESYLVKEVETDIRGIVNAIWDEPIADHLAPGSIGKTIAGSPIATALEVWEYQDRTLTQTIQLDPIQFNELAKIDNTTHYSNKMVTVYREENGSTEQEVTVWAEKNGQRVVISSNCTVTIKDSAGAVNWTATGSSPNVDGIYKFINPMNALADSSYYIVIAIEVDGSLRTSQQAFFTIG